MSDATTIDATQLETAGSEGPNRAYLVVREGERSQVIDVDEGDEIVVGRSSAVTVRLDDAKASREHARIWRRGGQLGLVDLGSRNGTRLNHEILRGGERPLRSGDVVRIGAAEILVAEGSGGGATRGNRLGAELQRVRTTAAGGIATLVRMRVGADDLARMAAVLAAAAVVEAQGDGEYACLFAGDAGARIAELRRLAPAATISQAQAPVDGESAAALWAKAGRGAEPSARARPAAPSLPGVVVADEAMVRVFELVRKVAAAPTTVLILGETGVGKEVVAEQIHLQSGRAKGPFVRLNCGSLPETLLESELFGHEKGAFTGAEQRKIGYLEAADGGTLFLDEIGELAATMQAKLLRVIENRRVMRVGGREEIAVDVRIIAATNRELAAEVKAGRFREDLYFRISPFVIDVPPLRERPAEVGLLAELFARQFALRLGVSPPVIHADAAAALRRHRWPGNVRELRNAIERAIVLADGGDIGLEDLPEQVRRADAAPATGAIRDQLADLEQRRIEEALAAEGGNQTRAAKRLGLSRRALIYKLEKYGLKR
ncbi:MAG: acetoacetate metabolism regulatory protein AtoC [bacterium]|nr:acetoacetate metabolism regulatory protein AtoC [bacterium]